MARKFSLLQLVGASLLWCLGCAAPSEQAGTRDPTGQPADDDDVETSSARGSESDSAEQPEAQPERPGVAAALDGGSRPTSPVRTAVDARALDVPGRADAGKIGESVRADAATQPLDESPATTTAACQGKLGAKRGKSSQTLTIKGVRRSFVYYAPKGLDANTPVPLVIIPHGTNMSGQGMFDITRYAELADREHFVALFPDGIDGPGSLAPWDVGSGVCGLGAVVAGRGDDQAFLDGLLAFVEADQCVDSQHIFMTGFSMGGYFSHETACVNSKIAAIGPHSAGTHDLSKCPAKYKPAILFHFKSDSLISYDCGVGARDQLVKRNGCDAKQPDVVKVKGGACEYYKGCPADGQVAFCSFDGPSVLDDGLPSGHGWSGGAKVGGESFAAITGSESATELGWAFFKKYAW